MVDGLGGAAEFGTDCLEVEVVELHLDEEEIELLGWVQHIQNGICSCPRRCLVVGIGEHHLHIVAEVVIYPDLASLWCDEVDFRIGSSDSRMFAIGFRNDRQGYVLRTSFFKGTNVNSISTIVNGAMVWKNRPTAPICPDAGDVKVMVFEGFMDYLSLLTMRGVNKLDCDCVVLNSTVNVGEAISFLRKHERIECWLDNDDAGRQCLKFIQDRCGEENVADMSQTYCRNNDLNDYLTRTIKENELQHRKLGKGL